MDNYLLYVAAVAVIGAAVFAYLRFGKAAAGAIVALGALVLAYLKGRAEAREAVLRELEKKGQKDARKREAEVERADRAASDVVRDTGSDPGKLREHDPFERR